MGSAVVKDYFIDECWFKTKKILIKYSIVYKITVVTLKPTFAARCLFLPHTGVSLANFFAAVSFVNLHFCPIFFFVAHNVASLAKIQFQSRDLL